MRYCSCATVTLVVVLFTWNCSSGCVVLFMRYSTLATVLFTWYCSSVTAGSLPRAVTISNDTDVAALRARLETIVKKAEDAEAQAAAAHHHVQAARLLEEESKAAALE
jgi:hypothetical protein